MLVLGERLGMREEVVGSSWTSAFSWASVLPDYLKLCRSQFQWASQPPSGQELSLPSTLST